VESEAGTTDAEGAASNYVSHRLAKAERHLAKNHYRRALAELDQATLNLSHTDAREDFDRLERLLDQLARAASGRRAEKALELKQTAYSEITRRVVQQARPTQYPPSAPDASFGLGVFILGGAACGFIIGVVLGSGGGGGGDIPSLNALVALFAGVIGSVVGALVGLMTATFVEPLRKRPPREPPR
jgi:hypothetical protein